MIKPREKHPIAVRKPGYDPETGFPRLCTAEEKENQVRLERFRERLNNLEAIPAAPITKC